MNLRTYITGFILSITLTLAAFWLVSQDMSREFAIGALIILAVAQLFVQLFCFLHVGHGTRPRWNLITLIFTGFIVVVLVGGTVWVMYHVSGSHADMSELYEGEEVSPYTQGD